MDKEVTKKNFEQTVVVFGEYKNKKNFSKTQNKVRNGRTWGKNTLNPIKSQLEQSKKEEILEENVANKPLPTIVEVEYYSRKLDLDDADSLTMETSLKDDLDADSLDAVELIMQIEEEFEVEIPDEVASNMKTVKDIVDYIEANK